MQQAVTSEDIILLENEFKEISDDNKQVKYILSRLIDGFIIFARLENEVLAKHTEAREAFEREKRRLLEEKQKSDDEIESLNTQLRAARKLVDEANFKLQGEKEAKSRLEKELRAICNALSDQRNHLHDETRDKLTSLHEHFDVPGDRMEAITEMDSTNSIMSDLSYTRDEDDILCEKRRSRRRRSSSVPVQQVSSPKKRKSTKTYKIEQGEKLYATTTVEVPSSGPIRASSTIETVPKTPLSARNALFQPSAPPLTDSEDDFHPRQQPVFETPKAASFRTLPVRSHNFIQKAMIKAEQCNSCQKKMRFSAMGLKCKNCKVICHIPCKENLPVVCAPVVETPIGKGQAGTVSDYAPLTAPMVPSLIVHCIKEIEERGLTEVGLYRVPGSEKEVKSLKEKFLKGKSVPNLTIIPDINTVCGCVKEFLRSLKEPLVTHIRWNDFVKATESLLDQDEKQTRLYQLISELPRPNRDTLSFLALHLQRIANSPECRMPVENLAKMFGPTVVGYSNDTNCNPVFEVGRANRVMEELLRIPQEYWENFLKEEQVLSKTFSTSSGGFFSPTLTPARRQFMKRREFFADSP